jgi:hypothetical protein
MAMEGYLFYMTTFNKYIIINTVCYKNYKFLRINFKAIIVSMIIKINAPGEDRTHDLQIMRLTRCLLRYQGTCEIKKKNLQFLQNHLRSLNMSPGKVSIQTFDKLSSINRPERNWQC